MARISRIKKSRVERYCKPGGHTIPVGSAYSYAAPGYHGREIYACTAHPFRPSHLTTSLASGPLAAQEEFDDALNEINQGSDEALEELQSALEALQSAVREYADEREQALDAWEYGNSQLEELNDIAQQAADDAEAFEIEEWSGDQEAFDWDPDEHPEPEDEESPEWAAWEEASDAHEAAVEDRQNHVEAQFEAASEMSCGLEF